MTEEHSERYKRISESDDPDLKLVNGTPSDRMSGLRPLLAHSKGKTILDVGCHVGTIAEAFAANGARSIDGVDLFRPGVEQARERLKTYPTKCRFEVCDLSAAPGSLVECIPDLLGSYDIVLYLGVHHHLSRQMPADRLAELVTFLAGKTAQLFAVRTPRQHFEPLHDLLITAGLVEWKRTSRRGKVGQLRIYRNLCYEVPQKNLFGKLISLFD